MSSPGGHLEGPVARAGDALVAANLKADLALAHLEPLDEVIMDMRAGNRGAGLEPEVDLDAPTLGIYREDVRDLAGGGVMQPSAGFEGAGRGMERMVARHDGL